MSDDAGRPPTYDLSKKTQLTALCNEIQKLASRGLTKEQCAGSLGISRSTYMQYQKDNPELLDAYDVGASKGVAVLANKLYDLAYSGSERSLIFFLKTRGGFNETQNINLTGGLLTQRIPDDANIEEATRVYRELMKGIVSDPLNE